jgi:hypothetical protein
MVSSEFSTAAGRPWERSKLILSLHASQNQYRRTAAEVLWKMVEMNAA